MAAGSRQVALLRGINVGGKNKLPMGDLVAMFEGAECSDVSSYIQSGNLVFRAPQSVLKTLHSRISGGIKRHFGYQVPVVLRSEEDLQRVIDQNPFGAEDVKTLHVAFLADQPGRTQLASLDPERSPGDRFQCVGREIYLHCPGGMARTKLTNAYFDGRLATVSTMRNWKTVTKLLELCQA